MNRVFVCFFSFLTLSLAQLSWAEGSLSAQAEGSLSSGAEGSTKRVVSIDGAITEIVYALGQENRLVGIDTTSVFPAQARELPNVGYMRALSGEGILSLNPSLVIASEEAGPKKVLDNLKQAGLNIEIIPSERSIGGVMAKIQAVAALLDAEEKGQALIDAIHEQSAEIQARTQSLGGPSPRVMFLLAAGGHGASVAGGNTQAEAMIELMGGTNVVDNFDSYKPLSPEGAIKAAPEVIIIAERADRPLDLKQYPALKLTPAYQNQRILRADSMLLLGFGPRIAEAMATMEKVLYPDDTSVAQASTIVSSIK